MTDPVSEQGYLILRPPLSRPRALLVDLDDTVVSDSANAEANWQAACEMAAAPFGVPVAPLLEAIHEERAWFWSDPARHREGRADLVAARRRIVAAVVERAWGGRGDAAALVEAVVTAYGDRTEQDRAVLPGALDALGELRALGIRLALVTNGSASVQRGKIERFGLGPVFDAVVVEGELGIGKPDADVYRHALASLVAAPEETWMVGDNLLWDVLAPQRLGLRGVWLPPRAAGAEASLPDAAAVTAQCGDTGLPDAVVLDLGALVRLIQAQPEA